MNDNNKKSHLGTPRFSVLFRCFRIFISFAICCPLLVSFYFGFSFFRMHSCLQHFSPCGGHVHNAQVCVCVCSLCVWFASVTKEELDSRGSAQTRRASRSSTFDNQMSIASVYIYTPKNRAMCAL